MENRKYWTFGDSSSKKKHFKNYMELRQKAGKALITTVLVYLTVLYLNHGQGVFSFKITSAFLIERFMEMFFAFFFLLSVFYSHSAISSYINSNSPKGLHPVYKTLLEAFMVVVSTIVLLTLIDYLPLSLIYPNPAPDYASLRATYVVSVVLSLFLYYMVERERNRRQLHGEQLRSAQLEKENYQSQLQTLKEQVNPHFLFNSLNVLGSLIHKDQDKAGEFVRRLSEVYRSFLDNAQQDVVSLSKELELADAYIYLLKTRFGDNLHFEINVSEERLNDQLPHGALQMLIENAVKHNGSTNRKPLFVKIYTELNRLVVTNKIQPRLENITSTQTGLKNIQNRYRYLTEDPIVIARNSESFTVKLPLLKVEEYENNNY